MFTCSCVRRLLPSGIVRDMDPLSRYQAMNDTPNAQ